MACKSCKKSSRRKRTHKKRSRKAGGPSLINITRQIRRAGRISGIGKITNSLSSAGLQKALSSV